MQIECPKPAYDRLVKSGLDKKVLEAREKVGNILLNRNALYSEVAQEIFEKARIYLSNPHKLDEEREVYQDIFNLEKVLLENETCSILDEEKIFIEFPSLLAIAVLGSDISNFEKYGFSNRRQLEESIASFCIGEREVIRYQGYFGDYFWRRGKYKNMLSNSYHGDCHIFQIDVSGQEYEEKDLFGKHKLFDTWKDVADFRRGINADYSDWSLFLITILKYAEAIGNSKMHEIVNWRDVLKKVGAVGTQTTEAMFGDGNTIHKLELLKERPILIEDKLKDIKSFPLSIRCNSGIYYYPYIRDKKLSLIRKQSDGEMELPFKGAIFERKKFAPYIIYEEEDLPELLTGIYRLFARDRSALPKIMDMFLSENQ